MEESSLTILLSPLALPNNLYPVHHITHLHTTKRFFETLRNSPFSLASHKTEKHGTS
jgi:hypothetical protein